MSDMYVCSCVSMYECMYVSIYVDTYLNDWHHCDNTCMEQLGTNMVALM